MTEQIVSKSLLRGLVNLGNTCYLNSVLQSLVSTKTFILIIKCSGTVSGNVTEEICNILKKMEVKGPPIVPTRFKSIVDDLHPFFKGTDQQDAEEFLSLLLNWLQDELKDCPCDIGDLGTVESNIIRETFGFMFRYNTLCDVCDLEVEKTDPPLFILPVQVPYTGSWNLSDCLVKELEKEHLPDFVCSCCRNRGHCHKEAEIIHPPTLLVVQMKRYAMLPGGQAVKTCTPVTLPRKMILQPSPFRRPEEQVHYSLFAVVQHYGQSTDEGHYTCFARRENGWYDIADETVTCAVEGDIVSLDHTRNSYLVFFEKGSEKDTTQVSLDSVSPCIAKDSSRKSDLAETSIGIAVGPPHKGAPKRKAGSKTSTKPKIPSAIDRKVPRTSAPTATISASEEPHPVARMPDKFTPIYLNQDDVPGAKFSRDRVEDHSVDELKRWLVCRGLIQSGPKDQLVARCRAAIANNRLQSIDPAVDQGKWYQEKRNAVYQDIPDSCRPPILPITGWGSFPAVQVPSSFSRPLIESYLIERHPTLDMDVVDSDGDLVAPDTMSVGTRKPLKRGEQYWKSGHVTQVGDNRQGAHYFLRAVVLSSFQRDRQYKVFVTCSNSTGYIVEGFCECRQRALGRCSHVAALLLHVLHDVERNGYEARTCTGRPQVWGQGTTKRKPGMVRNTDYPSRRSIVQKSHKDPRAVRHVDRMTGAEKVNFLTFLMQSFRSVLAWETVLTPVYEDFEITDEYCEFIGNRCCLFVENLQEIAAQQTSPCFLVTSGQSDDLEWNDMRCWMVTASRAKRVAGLTLLSAKSAYLYKELWNMEPSVTTEAMEYGITYEPVARVMYILEVRKDHPNSTIREAGLWALHEYPQLGCSPDGLVEDPVRTLRLLEVKCPHILKDHDPNKFDSVLDKQQLSRFCLTRETSGEVVLKRNHEFFYQIQMCLGIHDVDYCDLFVYSTHGHVLLPIEFDRPFWEDLKRKLLEIHATLILPEYFAMRTVRGLNPMILPTRFLPFLHDQSTQP